RYSFLDIGSFRRPYVKIRTPLDGQAIGVEEGQRRDASSSHVPPDLLTEEIVDHGHAEKLHLETVLVQPAPKLARGVKRAVIVAPAREAAPANRFEHDVRPLVRRLNQIPTARSQHAMHFAQVRVAVPDVLEDVEADDDLE